MCSVMEHPDAVSGLPASAGLCRNVERECLRLPSVSMQLLQVPCCCYFVSLLLYLSLPNSFFTTEMKCHFTSAPEPVIVLLLLWVNVIIGKLPTLTLVRISKVVNKSFFSRLKIV